MFSIRQLKEYLESNMASFEMLAHDTPILTIQDAKKYFDTDYAAPVLIAQTDNGLMVLIISAARGKIDFKGLGEKLGFTKFKLAGKKKAEKETGYQIGAMPLVGIKLPCIFDARLLKYDYIYVWR